MVPLLACAIEIVAVVDGVVTGVLWQCRKLVPDLMYHRGPTPFGERYLGSEVCDSFALGFCYRNSGSSSWSSYWRIVVVQEMYAKPNIPLRSNAFWFEI